MSLAIYLIGVACVVLVMLSSCFLGEISQGNIRDTPYESGILATGSSRVRFFAHYFLIAILFVVFDVESVFIYIWSSSVRQLGWLGFFEILFFISMIALSLFYVISLGVLNFSSGKAKNKEMVT